MKAERIAKLRKNASRVMRFFPDDLDWPVIKECLDAIEALQKERDELRAESARLKDALGDPTVRRLAKSYAADWNAKRLQADLVAARAEVERLKEAVECAAVNKAVECGDWDLSDKSSDDVTIFVCTVDVECVKVRVTSTDKSGVTSYSAEVIP